MVMVTGPEKDIQRGREFAKGDVWWKNVNPGSWPSEGVSSEEKMSVGRQESSK
jgi:hypothetical protein